MVIDGVSQTTGKERLVAVESAGESVLVVIRKRSAELGRVEIPALPILSVMTARPKGKQSINGTGEKVLNVEVRRNEVLLAVGRADAAVGLDDLMDALAGALPTG